MMNEHIEIIYPEKDSMRIVAGALKRSIRNYRIPVKVRQKTGIDSLNEIKEKWLIVLCDPDAVKDESIKERILEYSKRGEYSHILSLLVSGGSKNSFPEELKYEERPDGTVVEHEPLAANISAENISDSLKKLKVEQLRLFAPILGVSFDELNRRREKQLMQLGMAIGGAFLALAVIFLIFAASRMMTMASQNDSLESEYDVIEAARLEAEQERNEADKQYASLIAVSARLALNNGDTELAMLLSMEALSGSGGGGEAEAVLTDALNVFTRSGYVPVTSEYSYISDRYAETSEETEEYADVFPEKLTMRIPDGYVARDDDRYFTMGRRVISDSYGYALYSGSFYTEEDTINVWRVCFANDKYDDHYILAEDGSFSEFYSPMMLQDGTFRAEGYIDIETGSFICHYDPFNEQFLDDIIMLKRGDEGERTDVSHINSLNYMVVSYKPYNSDGKKGDTYLYSLDSGNLIEIKNGMYEIEYIDGLSEYLIGRTATGICLLDAESLECIYTIDDEFSSHGPMISVFRHPEYGDYLIFQTNNNYAVYELKSGERYFTLNRSDNLAHGRDGNLTYFPEVSSEGYFVLGAGDSIEIYRIWDGTVYDRIENIGEYVTAEPLGEYDPVTGCRSASAIWASNGIVYEYHENSISVPDGLEEKLRLASELMNGRMLTDDERNTYGL
ncbi:MAG: hypothetical protein ILP17_00065 [Lachnospiraceae bacterium]|nr:hypothetical protein [Lachnospiraceae bacterium]